MSFKLNRRAFLRSLSGGAAAGLALPVLECMLDSKGRFFHVAQAANVNPPVRYLAYMIQNGAPLGYADPVVNGNGTKSLSTAFSSLSHLSADINQITNMNATYVSAPNSGNEHAQSQVGFWTGHPPVNGVGSAPSIEWVLGKALGQGVTKFPCLTASLPRGWSDRNWDGNGKNTWIAANQPGSYLFTPQALANKLISGLTPTNAADATDQRRTTAILDQYMTDTKALQAKLSAADKARLDQHLTTVEQIVSQLAVVNNVCQAPSGNFVDVPTGGLSWAQQKAAVEAAMPVLAQLIVFAFQCDLTRYVLFEVANAAPKVADVMPSDDTDKNPSMNDHYWSHRPGMSGDLNGYYFDTKMQYWAQILDGMKASAEGDKTILYNSVSMLGSDVAFGAGHTWTNYPLITVGQAGGRLKTGQVLSGASGSSTGTTINNLHATLLTAVGLPTIKFGSDGTGQFPGLLT